MYKIKNNYADFIERLNRILKGGIRYEKERNDKTCNERYRM